MRKLFWLLMTVLLVNAFLPCLNAEEILTAAPDLGVVTPFLQQLVASHPNLLIVFLAIGALKFFVHPLIAAAHWYADRTETPKDNDFIARVEASKFLTWTVFVLDWFASVKLRR